MNLYVVVEGECEKTIYAKWIPLVNPTLTQVADLSGLVKDNFFIVSGGGFPRYYSVIENAIADINEANNIDRLVIAIDSEDQDYEEKYNEVMEFVSQFGCEKQIFFVVQHFCLEAWALGNRTMLRRNTSNPRLREYLRCFDVTKADPELLPPYPLDDLNRAQFAERYLRTMINDRYTSLTYSKRNPTILAQSGYFLQVKNRFLETNHLRSFKGFLDAFI